MPTDRSTRATHDLIASDRVEGTLVRSAGGTRIGTIERVMIEKLSGSVAYALLRIDGSVEMERKYLPIAWPRLTYDQILCAYQLDLLKEELSGIPCLGRNEYFDRNDPLNEIEIRDACRAKSYWGIAESW